MGTGRRQSEDGSTTDGYPVGGPESSDSRTTQREPEVDERNRVAWNLPLPRGAPFLLDSMQVVPPSSGPHERIGT